MQSLAANGWRAVAPDLRGYGETGPQGDVIAYRFANLARDVLGMVDALGLEKPVLIGHDFGGALAWSIARDHPDSITGIAVLNTPYTRRGDSDLVSMMRTYRGDTNYMVAFQSPGFAEAELERDVHSLFHNLMRRPGLKLGDFQANGRLRALPMSLFTGEPAMMGEPIMSEAELQVYIDAFTRTGFAGGLNWYRNLARNWSDSEASPERIDVPALMVTASDDFFLPPRTSDGMEAIVADLERAEIQDCGHWTQHERSAEVNAVLLDWLERRIRPLMT